MSEEVALAPQAELGAEAVALLQDLIRFDTTNPPGNEGEAQEYLRALLAGAGFECEIAARAPERPNLVARLRGEAPGPVLCLLGHADVVPVDPADWSGDPFSGELRGGEVWGRGAIDMKGQVAAEVAAAVSLARAGWRPARGDLLVIVTADEERGAGYGAKWLCEERPELVRCDMVVNEGGGVAIEIGGRRFYTVALGEKGVCRLRLRTRGRAGHGSMPRIGDNAIVRMAPLIERLAEQPPREPTAEGVGLLSGLLDEDFEGAGPDELVAAVDRVRAEDPAVADYLAEPLLGVTLSPVIVEGGVKENVIPARCELLVDCRVPTEHGEKHVRERVEALFGDGEWELEAPHGCVVGNRSPFEGTLADAIKSWIAEVDPGAVPVPAAMTGFSDSHWFRSAFGTVAYGFWPRNAMTLAEMEPLIHGADERVAVADVELSAGFFADLCRRVLGVSTNGVESATSGNGAGPPPPLRLGGMALRNGLMIHGPTSWAIAARANDGELVVASGRKPTFGSSVSGIPFVRGPLKLLEAFAVVPLARRRLPDARLPLEDLRVLAAAAAVTALSGALRRGRPPTFIRESFAAVLGAVPALVALSDSDLAAYHGVEHKAIGAYEQGKADPREVPKEHERCGSHLVAPLLAFSIAGQIALERLLDEPGPIARGATALGSVAIAAEMFAWSERNPDTAFARAFRRPGTEIQRRVATREPTDEQLEVGNAALAEILRAEGVATA